MRNRKLIALMTGALVLGFVAFRLVRLPGSVFTNRVQTIALLPLQSTAGGAEPDIFADGMTAEIIDALSRVPSLRVISRASVMFYKSGNPKPEQTAKDLHAESVLTGSIANGGGRFKVSLALTRAAGGEPVWTATYERGLNEAALLPEQVAQRVAAALGVSPATPASAAGHASNPEAFQAYLQGRLLAAQTDEGPTRRAIALLENAIRLDPQYAPPQAALSRAYQNLASVAAAPKDVFPQAKRAALEAVRLDESLSEGHLALAGVLMNFDWDWSGAEREFQRAIELNPSSADAHYLYGTYLSILQRYDPAAAEYEKARALDPRSITYSLLLADMLVSARQYDRAIAESRKLIHDAPDFAWGYAWLGMAKAQKREFPEALEALKKANALDQSYTMRHFLAAVQAAAGNQGEARKLLAGLEDEAKHRYVCAYEIATVYSNLGENDKAYEWMQRGVKEHADCMLRLKTEPWMDSLRADPRYAPLLRQVGFREIPR